MAGLVHLFFSLLGLSISRGPIPSADLPTNVGCMTNSDCSFDTACAHNICINPCSVHPCGRNADCRPIAHQPVCTCWSGFRGDPYDYCRKETSIGEDLVKSENRLMVAIGIGEVDKCTLEIEGNGSVNCTGDVRRNVCDIECDGNYEGTFICTPEKGWTSKLPYCAREVPKEAASCPENEIYSKCVVPCNNCQMRGDCKFLVCIDGCDCQKGYFRDYNRKCILASECSAKSEVDKCTLDIEGNGSVNCTGNVRRNVCDIECDGNYEGTFICTPEKGWTSKLPDCAREVPKDEPIGTHAGGCSAVICEPFCRGKGMRGYCKEVYPGGEKKCFCKK